MEDAGRIGLAEAPGIGDVERVDALAALVEAAHQHRVPGAPEEGVAHRRRAVHVVLVRVGGRCQEVQVRKYAARNEGEALLAGHGVECVQHAVVGACVHHVRAFSRSVVGGHEVEYGGFRTARTFCKGTAACPRTVGPTRRCRRGHCGAATAAAPAGRGTAERPPSNSGPRARHHPAGSSAAAARRLRALRRSWPRRVVSRLTHRKGTAVVPLLLTVMIFRLRGAGICSRLPTPPGNPASRRC